MVITSCSPEQTRYWGKLIGGALESGDVVALKGELGSGKTTLAQGIAQGVGVSEECYVTSPTFTLINEYKGRIPIYHLDFYRINSFAELEDLGIEEYLYGAGVTLIEWPEKILSWLSLDCLLVILDCLEGDERSISLQGKGRRSSERMARIQGIVLKGKERSEPGV